MKKMIIYTAKLTKQKLIAIVLAVAVILAAIILIAGGLQSRAADSTLTDNTKQSIKTSKNIKTNDERLAYLSDFGWVVKPDPITTQEVLIPEEFDDVYTEYNELQKLQGFDLTKYSGKRVKRYTYEIENYGDEKMNIYANILVYKNEVIAGDVMSPELGGFMHGLKRP